MMWIEKLKYEASCHKLSHTHTQIYIYIYIYITCSKLQSVSTIHGSTWEEKNTGQYSRIRKWNEDII